jgi:flagellar basal-body rod modification protein FlgD
MTTTTSTPATTPTTGSAATAAAAGTAGGQQIAGNFDEFLQLLTTQLQNQDPLDPLDTNQFTQQLVEFASVEQQVDMNTNMQTLISLQETTAATQALQLVGSTVTVNGNNATLSNATGSPATWNLNASGPGTAAITISSSTGQTAYTGTTTLNSGNQSFTWNGQGNNGVQWPDGTYTIAVTGTGANGQPITVSTQVQGTVTGVNMTQTPPTLTIGGQNYPISSIQSLGSGSTGSTITSGLSNLNTSISNLTSTIGTLIQSL